MTQSIIACQIRNNNTKLYLQNNKAYRRKGSVFSLKNYRDIMFQVPVIDLNDNHLKMINELCISSSSFDEKSGKTDVQRKTILVLDHYMKTLDEHCFILFKEATNFLTQETRFNGRRAVLVRGTKKEHPVRLSEHFIERKDAQKKLKLDERLHQLQYFIEAIVSAHENGIHMRDDGESYVYATEAERIKIMPQPYFRWPYNESFDWSKKEHLDLMKHKEQEIYEAQAKRQKHDILTLGKCLISWLSGVSCRNIKAVMDHKTLPEDFVKLLEDMVDNKRSNRPSARKLKEKFDLIKF